MIRTQIYIPDDIHRDLTLLAQQEGTNFSGLIREGALEIIKIKKLTKKTDLKNFVGAYKGNITVTGDDAVDDYYQNNVV